MPVPKEFFADQSVVVSSDIAGVFGDPLDALKFWQSVLPKETAVKLELLRWKHLSPFTVMTLSKYLAGFHGRLGGESISQSLVDPIDTLKVVTLHSLLLDTTKLSSEYQVIEQQRASIIPLYLLLHQREAERLSTQQLEDIPTVLAVENDITRRSTVQTIDTVQKLREKDYPAIGVFDVVHAMRAMNPNLSYKKKWQRMLRLFDVAVQKIGQSLTHLPIGTNTEDSISISEVNSSMWEDLGQAIKDSGSRVIIEHQLDSISIVRTDPNKDISLKERAHKILDTLFSRGVIPTPDQRSNADS